MTFGGLETTELLLAAGLGALIGLAGLWTPWRPAVPPATALAAASVLWLLDLAPLVVPIGVAVVALGALTRAGQWPLTVAGTVLAASGLAALVPGWAVMLMVATAGAAGWALTELTEQGRSRVTAAMVIVALWGIAWTVPDIEETTIVVALCAVPAGLGLLFDPKVAAPGFVSLATVITWAGIEGGRGRPSAMVGAAGALLLVVVLAGATRSRQMARWWVPAIGIQIVLTGLMARVAGLQGSATAAALLAAAFLVADGLVLGGLRRLTTGPGSTAGPPTGPPPPEG